MPSQFQQQLEELTENITKYIPRSLLPGVVILIAIASYFFFKPPHTICDTLKDNLQEKQAGILFPTRVNKKTYPGKIQGVMESCRFGDSSGSCYEYFGILRRVAITLKEATPECIPAELKLIVTNYQRTDYYETIHEADRDRQELAETKYISQPLSTVMTDGLEMMVRKAWGETTPEPGPIRLSWFQESELATFCHLQDVLKKAKGDGWNAYVNSVLTKLPKEKAPPVVPGAPPIESNEKKTPPNEADFAAWKQRSLFALGCANYR